MPEPAARAGDDDPVARFCAATFQSGVDGDAGTEHRGREGGVEALGDRGCIGGWGKDVLLEGARSVVSGDLRVLAHAIRADEAGRAVATGGGDPLRVIDVSTLL